MGLFIAVSDVAAQSPSPQQSLPRYVSGGLLLSMQAQGADSCPYLCGTIGGSGVGWTGSLLGDVSDHLAVGVEISRGGTLTALQSGRLLPSGTVEAKHRDTAVSGVFRFSHVAPGDQVDLRSVAGGGVVIRTTNRNRIGADQKEVLTDAVPAVLGGVDVAVSLGPRAALVPFVRAHYLFDKDEGRGGVPERGVSSFILRLGATCELRF